MEVQQQTLGGRYQLLNVLGTGGMAVVWRARDEVLGRTVAVKLLAGQFANDPVSRSRIRDEARAAATLSPHPNIAQVYDYGESTDDGAPLPYVVMELVNGPTLQQRVASGPLSPRTVFRICGEVASALAAAHADGLVHRDIKPANVMVTVSGAKVVDFGIAAVAGPRDPEDVLLGTPAYLAPERLMGGPVEPATDVYALGVLLYRLLADESPWSVDTTTQMLSAHVYLEPTPLPDLPGVPASVTDLVQRCLRKDPAERPSAAEASAILVTATETSSEISAGPSAASGSAVLLAGTETSNPLVRAQPAPVAHVVPTGTDASQSSDWPPDGSADESPSNGRGYDQSPNAEHSREISGQFVAAGPPSRPLTRRAQALERLAAVHAARAQNGGAATGASAQSGAGGAAQSGVGGAAQSGVGGAAQSGVGGAAQTGTGSAFLAGGLAGAAAARAGAAPAGAAPAGAGARPGVEGGAGTGGSAGGSAGGVAAGGDGGGAGPAGVPAPRSAVMGRPARPPAGLNGPGANDSKSGVAVPPDRRAKRKRIALIGGGGFAVVLIVALIWWLLAPVDGVGRPDKHDAAAPPAADGQLSPAENASTAPGTVPALGPTRVGGAVLPGPGHVPPTAVRPGAPAGGGRTTHATEPAAPHTGGPASSAPASSAPPAGGTTKTLSSTGGTVVARCEGSKAELLSWAPKDPYKFFKVSAGPAVTTSIVFKHGVTRVRMTITCVSGVPSTVNLVL